MTEPEPSRPTRLVRLSLRLLPWVLGLASGAALLVARTAPVAASGAALDGLAVIAATTLAGYVLESTHWFIAALHPPNRHVALVYLLPRLVSTALGLAIAYLLDVPWSESILVAYVATIVIETLIRIGLRRCAPATVQRADACAAGPRLERKTRMGVGRALLTCITAVLFVLAFSLTSWAFVAREMLMDARIWTRNLHQSGLYSTLVQTLSYSAQDAALQQRGNARQVAELLTEDDLHLAGQAVLPEPWTTTWLQESLAATLAWMQTPSNQRVPPLSIPISDIERHAKDAASLLLDQHLATLPTCAPGMPVNAYCRPPGMSVQAFAATYKLQNMAIADEVLAMIPAELDFSTAVSLFGSPFQKPLRYLDRARSAVQALDRGMALSRMLCLALLALLWFLTSVTRSSRLRGLGVTLLAAALVTWATSYAALSLLPQRILAETSADLPTGLSIALQDLIRAMLSTVHSRVATGTLVLAGLGLLFIWVPLLAPHTKVWTHPIPLLDAARTGVLVLSLVGVLWMLYARAGERLYARASQLYRGQDVAAANALYRQTDRFYPFRITGMAGDIIDRTRRDLYTSQLYLDAQTAFQAGDWQTAVQHDEAFLLTQPTLQLRDSTQARLAEALILWARSLQASGQYERALDRYRFLRDEDLGRGRQFEGQPIRVHRAIGSLYLDWGDAQIGQDPEAALATYRRALVDTDDPGVWALAEARMVDAYCAWHTQRRQAGDAQRAARICIELGNAFPALTPDPCAVCAP